MTREPRQLLESNRGDGYSATSAGSSDGGAGVLRESCWFSGFAHGLRAGPVKNGRWKAKRKNGNAKAG